MYRFYFLFLYIYINFKANSYCNLSYKNKIIYFRNSNHFIKSIRKSVIIIDHRRSVLARMTRHCGRPPIDIARRRRGERVAS